MVLRAIAVTTVHDARLFGMRFELTFPQPFLHGELDFQCLRLAPTVDHDIIRIPFERAAGEFPSHPQVEHVMQEDICQERRGDAALRRASIAWHSYSLVGLGGCLQPSLDVQKNPRTVRVLSDRVQHQGWISFMANVSQLTSKISGRTGTSNQ
jgi:hypothetical protein